MEILASWLSLKMWIKVWLFGLNGIFLGALAFLDTPEARWVLLAYLACIPLLVGLMIKQRGLTRLLGIAHLLPWLPLLAYLLLRLTSSQLGARLTYQSAPMLVSYLWLLTVYLVICLAFDGWDVRRYWRGERYVFGSPDTVRTGASNAYP